MMCEGEVGGKGEEEAGGKPLAILRRRKSGTF
jgi:hypothetical protein